MKTTKTLALLLVTGSLGVAVVQAGVYTFQPAPADLWDLDHYKYYTWGIGWSIPDGETLTGATLFIDNINDWQVEPDILYIHLLDDPTIGVTSGTDNQNPADHFQGQGVLLTTYTDDDGWPNPPEDWIYTFAATQLDDLESYLANGVFGFGFDPDCHYFNDGITLTIETTETVPEPSVGLLVSVGLGLAGWGKRRVR